MEISKYLYEKAVEMHEIAFRRVSHDEKKYARSTGYMLQSLFGKRVWTLKDLSDEQLLKVIAWSEHRLDRSKPRPVK